jgi:hypothetical protein
MVKASQRNLVMSLQKVYGNTIHVALLNVGGGVSEEDIWLNPRKVAAKFWELYSQDREKWTSDLLVAANGDGAVQIQEGGLIIAATAA